VKILWRDIPESVIVADMPGMKDGDTDSSHFAYCNIFLCGWTFLFVPASSRSGFLRVSWLCYLSPL
jgi:hypothetical protein